MKVIFVYLAKVAINRRLFRSAPMTYSLLAAYTPPDIETKIVDEAFETIDFDEQVDLVALTFVVPLSIRAYEVARQFRKRGRTVVCGGPHATLMPQEAARHFDAVVIGEGDLLWPRLLDDYRHGCLRKFYKNSTPIDPTRIPAPRNDLLNHKGYSVLNSVQATRGCPFACRFCTTRTLYPRYSMQPIREVARQMERVHGNVIQRRIIQFWDDNLFGNPAWAKRLLAEITPLKKIWFGQATFSVMEDARLVRLAAKSGCRCLFVGLESFNTSSLKNTRKGHNIVASYKKGIDVLHDNGISVYAGIMFGFDQDDRDIFATTLEQCIDLGIDMVAPRIVVPYPGMPFFDELLRSNRILHTDWSRYNGNHAVFRPARMSATELERGLRWFDRKFHACASIARRLWKSKAFPLGMLPVNIAKNDANRRRRKSCLPE